MNKEIGVIAEQHASWYSENIKKIIKHVYKDAFIHGWKHGQEDAR